MKEVIIMHQCPIDMFPYTIEPGDTLLTISGRFNTSVNLISSGNPGINSDNLSVGKVICIPSRLIQTFYNQSISGKTQYSRQEVDLINEMRRLWEDYITWSRMVILSMTENLPDVDLVTKRLLRNPSDLATLLKTYYGDEVATKFEELLTEYLVIAMELLKTTMSGDKTAAFEAERKWYANADEIVAFFASINPYWKEKTWKEMLYELISLSKDEAMDRANKYYAADILVYDKIKNQSLEMADIMSEGIISQFPNKFQKLTFK